jgi:hypothetical protein
VTDVIQNAAKMDSLPGHLWSYVTYNADVNSDRELERLRRIRDETARLIQLVNEARSKKRPDPWLPRLLFALEREFKLAGGGSTGVSNWRGNRRGRFVDYCHAAIQTLPQPYRPKPIGSRWERLYTERKTEKEPARTPLQERVWVGKAHPVLTKY